MTWRVLGDPVATEADLALEVVAIERARRSIAYTPRLWVPTWQPRQGLSRVLGPALDEFRRQTFAGQRPMWLLSAPPRHGKTELCGKALATDFLWRHPGRSVLYATSTDDRAVDVSRTVRRVAGHLSTCAGDAGHLARREGGAWTSTAWETEGGGSFVAIGSGTATGGLNAGLRIFDDVTGSAERYRSGAERARAQRWLVEDILSRSDGAPGTLGMETRRGVMDLRAWAESEFPGEWTIVDVPRLVDDTSRHLLSRWDRRRDGEYLWPEVHGEDSRASQGVGVEVVQTSVIARAVWLALHQQVPMPEGGTAWERDWLTPTYHMHPDAMARRCDLRVLSIDPAGTQGGGNHSVIWHIGWENGRPRRLGAWRGQWGAPVLEETIRRLRGELRPHKILLEYTSNGRAVGQRLEQQFKHEIVPCNPSRSKRDRMDAVAPDLARGDLEFWAEAPDRDVALDRLTALTGHGDEVDDEADVITQAMIWYAERGGEQSLGDLLDDLGV